MKSVFLFAALTLGVALAQRPPTKCQKVKDEKKISSVPIVGAFTPECHPLGWYAPQQTWASTGFTWCVHPDSGRTIPGTSSPPGKPGVDCGKLDVTSSPLSDCEKERASVSDEVGHFRPQCDSEGWFSEKQCWRATGPCWCVDRSTGHEVAGTNDADGSTLNCTRSDLEMDPPLLGSGSSCPDGWYPQGGRCFTVLNSYTTWSKAELQCAVRGAHLASVHSHADNQFILSLAQMYTSSPVWIGGQDLSERLWRWSDGSNMGFFNWAPGQPNGGQGENCMVNTADGWHDYPCWTNFLSICSKEA